MRAAATERMRAEETDCARARALVRPPLPLSLSPLLSLTLVVTPRVRRLASALLAASAPSDAGASASLLGGVAAAARSGAARPLGCQPG